MITAVLCSIGILYLRNVQNTENTDEITVLQLIVRIGIVIDQLRTGLPIY